MYEGKVLLSKKYFSEAWEMDFELEELCWIYEKTMLRLEISAGMSKLRAETPQYFAPMEPGFTLQAAAIAKTTAPYIFGEMNIL